MRVGTPGFSGSRLREAREARGLSAVALADITGVTTQAVYSYEAERTTPSPDVLTKIATATNMPAGFFMLPDREPQRGTTYFRSMAAATKTARRRAERRIVWLDDVVDYLSEYVELPTPALPTLDVPDDFLLLSSDDIEDAADTVRSAWRLGPGPIANMVLLLENHGVIVARDHLGADALDGLSRFGDLSNRPYIFVGTDKGSSARWRFDAAHELGHLLLHHGVSAERLSKPEDFKRVEEQAHRFAAALLLPLAPFGDDLFGVNLDVLRSLKPKWNVSIAMMIMRARNARLLSPEEERRLWVAMGRRKWRTREPLDDTTPIEEPRLLRRAFEILLESGEQTAADVAARLLRPVGDIELLAGLPEGYLSDFAPVSLLAPRQDSGNDANEGGPPAKLIHFPSR